MRAPGFRPHIREQGRVSKSFWSFNCSWEIFFKFFRVGFESILGAKRRISIIFSRRTFFCCLLFHPFKGKFNKKKTRKKCTEKNINILISCCGRWLGNSKISADITKKKMMSSASMLSRSMLDYSWASESEQEKKKSSFHSNQMENSKTDSTSCERWHNCSNKKERKDFRGVLSTRQCAFQQFDWFHLSTQFWARTEGRPSPSMMSSADLWEGFFYGRKFKLKRDELGNVKALSCGNSVMLKCVTRREKRVARLPAPDNFQFAPTLKKLMWRNFHIHSRMKSKSTSESWD